MNTDLTVDFAGAQLAMNSMTGAKSMVSLAMGLEALAVATGLRHYLALDLLEADFDGADVLHNLPSLHLDVILQTEIVARLVTGAFALPLVGDLGDETLCVGVAVSAPRGNGACLLFLGRNGPDLAQAVIAETMGLASMAASYLVDSLARLRRESCTLSSRELECLCLSASGLSAKETARKLGISSRTVEDYLANCRVRLNASTSPSAALQAVRKGWISFEDIEAAAGAFSRPYTGQRRTR